MAYVLTIWLFWVSPFDAALIQYRGTSCDTALNEILTESIGDGVTSYEVVKCEVVQDI